MSTEPTLSFPKRFLWGAATSAHQVEGDTHNQWSVWELENAHSLAAQAEYHWHDTPQWGTIQRAAKNPTNYVSGKAVNHFEKYEEDFDLLEAMHMNAYRFSIEWSRVEPKEGSWDAAAIDHYKKYISSLRKRNIEPIVTLIHFSLPVWFTDKGGFARKSNNSYVTRYAEKIMSELGSSVRYIVTINEPDVYAYCSYWKQEWPPAESSKWKAYRVMKNQLSCHRAMVKVLKKINSKYRIGITKNAVHFYPGDTAWLSRLSADLLQYFQDTFWIKKIARQSDFLGLNYYQSQRVLGYRVHNSEAAEYSDVDWMLAPADIEYVLERWHRQFKKPILVTENGLADATDEHRQDWLKETIIGMERARKAGVPLIGYLHWSLLDNFEWAQGRWPRFGLAAVHYGTGERTLRPSARWFGRVIKKIRGV